MGKKSSAIKISGYYVPQSACNTCLSHISPYNLSSEDLARARDPRTRSVTQNRPGATARPGQRQEQAVGYEYLWRNKWLTASAVTIDDMINSLQQAANELQAMKAKGVTLRQGDSTEDDYA